MAASWSWRCRSTCCTTISVAATSRIHSVNAYHWYSSTGWIMWNCQVNGLLDGTTICIFDGSPGGSKDKPDWTTLWRFVSKTKTTFFGAGAAFFAGCHQGRNRPRRRRRPVETARAWGQRDRRSPAIPSNGSTNVLPRSRRRQRQPSAGRDVLGEHVRRHRLRRRLHRRQPELPQTPGTDAVPAAGLPPSKLSTNRAAP